MTEPLAGLDAVLVQSFIAPAALPFEVTLTSLAPLLAAAVGSSN